MQPNSDLTVDRRGLSGWNTPERRRASFHNLHNIHRRGLIFRAPASLDLVLEQNSAFARLPCLTQLLKEPSFCALVIVQDRRIVFEHQAADFATDKFHSIQSITKTFVHLALGALIESGKVDASPAFVTIAATCAARLCPLARSITHPSISVFGEV